MAYPDHKICRCVKHHRIVVINDNFLSYIRFIGVQIFTRTSNKMAITIYNLRSI